MSSAAVFVVLFALTLGLVLGAVLSGLYSRLRTHLSVVGLAALSLASTIVAAKRLGQDYDVHAAGWIAPVHLALAKIATAAYLLPATTGVLLLAGMPVRRWHRRAAFSAVLLTLVAACTGVWMILCSPRRA